MQESSEKKVPFVIFCYGVSEEVKHNIILNNKKGLTKIYPVCFNFDEDSINVINDIAVLHDCDMISANKGQTISTEIKNLKITGKKFNISKNSFNFIPVCSKEKIESHKNFLNNRIKNDPSNSNKDVIMSRYKRLFSKSVKVVLPEELKKNSPFMREFDYIFKFMTNIQKDIVTINRISHKKEIYVPLQFLKILKNKISSLKKIFNSIENVIVDAN
jgi:hypothetical protein